MADVFQQRTSCLLCGGTKFDSILNLGMLHLNAFPAVGEEDPARAPLHVVHCVDCHLLQLRDTVDPDLLYRTYWYRSGTNQTMRDALADVVSELPVPLSPGDVVVDIGSNDNTLLNSYSVKGLVRVGFEPSNIALEAPGDGISVVNDYFHLLPSLQNRAKVVTSIAMFYGLRDPHPFIEDVRATMAPGGVWVLQLAYLPSILERNAFDGICHEHVAYYSLSTLERLLGMHKMHVFDAKLVDLNEGSIRLYISSEPRSETPRLRDLRARETEKRLDVVGPYLAFARRVLAIRESVRSFLTESASRGVVVHGYGASTKGNTLLQYFGIDKSLLPLIWERQPQKWGRTTVGTRIPIISEEEGRKRSPSYLFILPWHFAPEFQTREKEYLAKGGAMVIPLPKFKVVP